MTAVYSLHGLFCYAEDCSHLSRSRAPQSSSEQTVWLRDGGRVSQWVVSVCIRSWSSEVISASSLGQRLHECIKISSHGNTGNPLFASLSVHTAQCRVCFIWTLQGAQSLEMHDCFGNLIPFINFMVPTFFHKSVPKAGRRQLTLAVTFSLLNSDKLFLSLSLLLLALHAFYW